MPIRRRSLLFTSAALFAAACARPASPEAAPTVGLAPDFERWNQEAQGILSDVLDTLRTFDDFHAFRVSTAAASNIRLPAELTWDAPTGTAWDEATHVTRGLPGRADRLFSAVTTARIDPTLWRSQRALADATHDLLDLADVLGTYRDRVDRLPPGDAAGALDALDKAWAQWDTAAARWNIGRAELIRCGN